MPQKFFKDEEKNTKQNATNNETLTFAWLIGKRNKKNYRERFIIWKRKLKLDNKRTVVLLFLKYKCTNLLFKDDYFIPVLAIHK